MAFDETRHGSGLFELDGYQIPYIGEAALIANNRATGRYKDLADVERARTLSG